MKNDSLRKKLGLTQQELADYLLITRTQVAMAEKGLRSLPTKALFKLSYLELNNKPVATKSTQRIIAAEIEGQQAAAKKIMQEHARACSLKLAKLKRELILLRQQQQQNNDLLQTIHNSLAQLPAGKEGAADKLWLEIQQDNVLKRMKKSGLIAQSLLQLKINCLEFEAKEALKMVQ